jgi:hypothetical protein
MAPPISTDLFVAAVDGKYLVKLFARPRDLVAEPVEYIHREDRKVLRIGFYNS